MLECAIIARYYEAFNCNICINSAKDTTALQETKGCFKPKAKPIMKMDNETKLFMCPGRLYTARELFLLNDYDHYINCKQYPNGKSLNYQSSRLVDSFNFIALEIQKTEALKEKERKAKKNG